MLKSIQTERAPFILGIYSLAHFLVDFGCAIVVFRLFSQMPNENIAVAFVYNFFAFAMQMPIGMIADYLKNNALIAGIGCLLVLVSLLAVFVPFPVFIACIVAGIGNACFHVGGGADILSISKRGAALSGIYVSTGALGLFLGGAFYDQKFVAIFIICALVVFFTTFFCLRALFPMRAKRKYLKDSLGRSNEILDGFTDTDNSLRRTLVIVISCLLLTICLRSYLGFMLQFPWKTDFMSGLVVVLAVVLGKMTGGIIGDRFGWRRVSVISLTIAAILFIFSFESPIFGWLAVFLFNFTMPITLVALANLFPHHYGLMFGSTTLALFIGAVPVLLGSEPLITNPIGFCIITIISALLLFIGLSLYKRIRKNE